MDVGLLNVSVGDVASPGGKIGGHRHLVGLAGLNLTQGDKGLDFIAANDISATDAGFAVETNRLTLLFADGTQETLPLMNKSEAAEKIIEHIARLLE